MAKNTNSFLGKTEEELLDMAQELEQNPPGLDTMIDFIKAFPQSSMNVNAWRSVKMAMFAQEPPQDKNKIILLLSAILPLYPFSKSTLPDMVKTIWLDAVFIEKWDWVDAITQFYPDTVIIVAFKHYNYLDAFLENTHEDAPGKDAFRKELARRMRKIIATKSLDKFSENELYYISYAQRALRRYPEIANYFSLAELSHIKKVFDRTQTLPRIYTEDYAGANHVIEKILTHDKLKKQAKYIRKQVEKANPSLKQPTSKPRM